MSDEVGAGKAGTAGNKDIHKIKLGTDFPGSQISGLFVSQLVNINAD